MKEENVLQSNSIEEAIVLQSNSMERQ